MQKGCGFTDELKSEMQRFSNLESISQTEILESVDNIREICKKYVRPESDVIVAAFKAGDFKKALTWDYVWVILDSSDDKLYILSAITMMLKSSNLYNSLRSESPLCFYYANMLLWRYGESVFSLRNPEGVNARLLLLDAFLKFGMNEFCFGITEDLLRICEYVDDDAYRDILNVLKNNVEIIKKIERLDEMNIARNAKELMHLIAEDG